MADTSSAPRHPSIDARSLIAWPGYRSGLAIESIDRAVIGAIAKPLAHAIHEPTQIDEALKAGMGLLLPAQSWRNQLPTDHPKRQGTFATLPIHRPGFEFKPDEGGRSAAFLERYAADHIESEIGGRATLLTTPAHVLEDECRTGRQDELLLARLAAEEFQARQASFASGPGASTRELYATLVVQGRHARNVDVMDWLVRAYAALEVSGYLVIAANYGGSGVQTAGYAELALRLQASTGRPVVVACVGAVHLALMASGVAATWAGLHGMSFDFPPRQLPTREAAQAGGGASVVSIDEDDDAKDEKGLGVFVYHRDALGNVGQLGRKGEAARIAIFQNRPCLCGFHPPRVPPTERKAIVRHNAWSVAADARELIALDVIEAEKRLAEKVHHAARMREFLRMGKVSPGFLSVARTARRLRAAASDSVEEQS